MAIEEPKYTVIEASEKFELRAYNPMIVAETRVGGDMDDAGTAGFKVIANYIFGNNTSSESPSDTANESAKNKIKMTAPVSMKLESEQINMTAPVSMQAKKWSVVSSFCDA
ncbi:heme-binding protein [Oceanospirillaceae bacterium]|nr:heme-binding protein [Oceanospirillaceae bacterium]